jgi:hypothetical protein
MPDKIERLSLSELNARAIAAGFAKIQRVAENATDVSLVSWQGLSSEQGSGYFHVAVWYILDGDTVTAQKLGEPDVHYRLHK